MQYNTSLMVRIFSLFFSFFFDDDDDLLFVVVFVNTIIFLCSCYYYFVFDFQLLNDKTKTLISLCKFRFLFSFLLLFVCVIVCDNKIQQITICPNGAAAAVGSVQQLVVAKVQYTFRRYSVLLYQWPKIHYTTNRVHHQQRLKTFPCLRCCSLTTLQLALFFYKLFSLLFCELSLFALSFCLFLCACCCCVVTAK